MKLKGADMTLSKNKILALFATFFVALVLCSCASNNTENSDNQEYDPINDPNATALAATVYKNADSDCADLSARNADFASSGFELGDSCDIEFENDYKLTDVPFFDGDYEGEGKPVILSGDNGADIVIKINNGDFWTPAGLFDGCKATITLNSKGKYKDVQTSKGKAALDLSSNSAEDSSDSSGTLDDASTVASDNKDDNKVSSAGGPEGE